MHRSAAAVRTASETMEMSKWRTHMKLVIAATARSICAMT
jgi:hypothetical protein